MLQTAPTELRRTRFNFKLPPPRSNSFDLLIIFHWAATAQQQTTSQHPMNGSHKISQVFLWNVNVVFGFESISNQENAPILHLISVGQLLLLVRDWLSDSGGEKVFARLRNSYWRETKSLGPFSSLPHLYSSSCSSQKISRREDLRSRCWYKSRIFWFPLHQPAIELSTGLTLAPSCLFLTSAISTFGFFYITSFLIF